MAWLKRQVGTVDQITTSLAGLPTLPLSNPAPSSTAPLSSVTAASALKTITTRQVFIESVTGSTGFSTRTSLITSTITDAAQYAAITASEAATQPTASAGKSQAASPSSTLSDPSAQAKGKVSHTASIAGGVSGGVLFIALVAIAVFWACRRRRAGKREQEAYSKAELHSDDLKPDRNELAGSNAPRYMLEKQAEAVELPANEILLEKDSVQVEVNDANTLATSYRK